MYSGVVRCTPILQNAAYFWGGIRMNQAEKRDLAILACKARMGAIIGTFHAKSGHPGGSLSAADMFTYLYFKEMNVDPARPDDPDRDRFVLSKGHTCPGLYGVMAEKGYFDREECKTFRHLGSRLQGHPSMRPFCII